MSPRQRIVCALLIGIAAGAATAAMPHPIRMAGTGVGDIGLPLVGLMKFQQGESPYEVRLHGSSPALYPFTSMLFLSPLLLVPLALAAPLFCGVSSALLAYGVASTNERWRFLIFLTPSYWSALHSVQWSPLMTAALLFPALLPLALAKPQTGLVLAVAGRWSRWTIAVTALIVLISVAIYPTWPMDWLRYGRISTFNGRIPILVLPGFLLLLSAFAFRIREGRLLLAISLVAQRYFYDQLPLFLIPSNSRQMVMMLATSWIVAIASVATGWWEVSSGIQDSRVWSAVVVGMFFPALVMVMLRHRAAGQKSESEAAPV